MAETYKILAKNTPLNTDEHVLYSTSEGTEAILTNITVANRSTESKTFDINVVDELLTDNDLVGEPGTATVVMYQSQTSYDISSAYKFSTDQITWTTGGFPFAETWREFNNIGNKYVAFYGNPGNSTSYVTSTDALTWTINTLPGGGTGFNFQYTPAKKINNTLFVLPGTDNDMFTALNCIFSTTDLVTWNTRTIPNPNSVVSYMRTIDYGNGIYFGVGTELSSYYSSTDSITWTHSTALGVDCNFSNSFYVNGNFVAFGKDDAYVENLFFTTTDGVTLTQRTAPTQNGMILKSASNGSIIFMYDDNSNFYTSTDGITWGTTMVPFLSAIESIFETDLSCNGDTFIFSIRSTGGMTTPATSYYTSTDAVTWTTVAIPDTSLFSFRFNRFNASYNSFYSTNLVHSLYKNVTIPANTSKILEPGIVLGSENSILIKGSSDLTFSAYGVELS